MKSFRVGTIVGIPIKFDLTFLLVLPLFAYIIGTQVGQWVGILNETLGAGLSAAVLTGGPGTATVLGIVAAVGLFVGVILHELGHSLVARSFGIEISSITLWLFGGVAQMEDLPEDWKKELYIALAGPAVSVALGALSYVAFRSVPANGTLVTAMVAFVLGYLALMNVALAAFNMLPGFPMDGGRVLRALLARTRPYARATRMAAEVGKGFAILLGLFGLLGGGGLFMVAIAFVIYIGASSEAQQTTMRAAFEGVTVADIMTPAASVHTVDRGASVADLVDRMFVERHTGYPVTEGGRIVGMVTLEDARDVKDVERDAYTVEEIMSDDLHTISPETDAMEAISAMQRAGVGRLLVMRNDPDDPDQGFAGLISRTDLMTALDIIKTGGNVETSRDRGGEGSVSATVEP